MQNGGNDNSIIDSISKSNLQICKLVIFQIYNYRKDNNKKIFKMHCICKYDPANRELTTLLNRHDIIL